MTSTGAPASPLAWARPSPRRRPRPYPRPYPRPRPHSPPEQLPSPSCCPPLRASQRGAAPARYRRPPLPLRWRNRLIRRALVPPRAWPRAWRHQPEAPRTTRRGRDHASPHGSPCPYRSHPPAGYVSAPRRVHHGPRHRRMRPERPCCPASPPPPPPPPSAPPPPPPPHPSHAAGRDHR